MPWVALNASSMTCARLVCAGGTCAAIGQFVTPSRENEAPRGAVYAVCCLVAACCRYVLASDARDAVARKSARGKMAVRPGWAGYTVHRRRAPLGFDKPSCSAFFAARPTRLILVLPSCTQGAFKRGIRVAMGIGVGRPTGFA